MADDERREDEEQPVGGEDEATPEDQGPEEQPVGGEDDSSPQDPGAEEQPAPEATQAEDGDADEPQAEAPEPEEDEQGPEDGDAEEPQAEAPQPEEDEQGPEAEPSEEADAAGETSEGSGSKDKSPPGAELEPIKLEPQRELTAEERARVEAEAEERARVEAEATAEGGEEPVPAREAAVELASDARIQATGKRKTSIARVILLAGNGSFEINKRSLEEYFPRHQHQTFVRQPLLTSGYEGKVDVRVRVHGGGISGQAGAVRHGIARALTEIDGELRGELKRRGLLTRDARAKERRKAGLKKARKRPQFSKR
jgi:small subunit ribosomal protein S9